MFSTHGFKILFNHLPRKKQQLLDKSLVIKITINQYYIIFPTCTYFFTIHLKRLDQYYKTLYENSG